jgi:nitrogenase-associated protein
MTIVHFYEKPGCLTNAKQKKWLVSAGLLVVVHDLLQEPWKENRQMLRAFFGAMPIKDWFNPNAPDIKNGLVNPNNLDETQAIELLVKQPILIRRPLMQIDDQLYVGFDSEQIYVQNNLVITKPAPENAEKCSKSSRHEVYQP